MITFTYTINFQPEIKEVQPKTAIQQYSNIFLVAVRNFTCKMSEDAELLMTLYDGKEFKAITESYVVRWTKEGLMSDLDQMYNLRVMFTVSIFILSQLSTCSELIKCRNI